MFRWANQWQMWRSSEHWLIIWHTATVTLQPRVVVLLAFVPLLRSSLCHSLTYSNQLIPYLFQVHTCNAFAKTAICIFMPPSSVDGRRHTVFVLFVCAYVRPCVCVHPETLLALYLAEYLTHFHQTYTSDALWDRDECVKFRGQKIKVQGHGGITCWNRHCTGRGMQYSTSHVELNFLVLILHC